MDVVSREEKRIWFMTGIVISSAMTVFSLAWLIYLQNTHGSQVLHCTLSGGRNLDLPPISRFWEFPLSGVPGAAFVALAYKIRRVYGVKRIRMDRDARFNLGALFLIAGIITGTVIAFKFQFLFRDLQGLGISFLIGLALAAVLGYIVGVYTTWILTMVSLFFFGPLIGAGSAFVMGPFTGCGIAMVGGIFIHFSQSFLIGSVLCVSATLFLFLIFHYFERTDG